MVDLYKEIDFSRELRDAPEMESFLKEKAKEVQDELTSDHIKKPFLERSFDEFIIVCGMPNAEASKTEQFRAFFKAKILTHLEIMNKISLLEFQLDSNGNFMGTAILKFNTAQDAIDGLNKLHGLKFAKYELSAYSLYSFQQVLDVPDEFVSPVNLPKKELLQWNAENRQSQFTIHVGDKAYTFLISHLESEPINFLAKPIEEGTETQQSPLYDLFTPLHGGKNIIKWSINGTYLIEIMEEGFQLYGGKLLKRMSFFPHKGVREVEFSPCENYILSYNGTIVDAPNEDNFIVWQLKEVKKMRVFKALQQDIFSTFKWSYDGKFIGRISNHKISVYQMPDMNMITDSQGNQSSINVRNIQKFFWCSKQHIIICCSYVGNLREHDKQVSTRIVMFEIPSRREIKWRTISNECSDMDIIPGTNGQFLMALIKKIKNKKVVAHILQVANIRNRGQMDISEIEFSDKIHNYTADPHQGRIGFVFKTEELRGGESSTMLFHSQIYQIEEESKSFAIKDAGRFNNKNSNEIMFSASSGFFILINKDINSAHCGIMETGYTRKDKGKLISEITRTYNNLSYMNHAAFDQSGRYIFTCSEKTKSYQIWSAFGDQIYKDTIADAAGLNTIIWRPRLTALLDEKKEAEIQSNYKNYKKAYEDEDFKITNRKEWERKERRERLKKEFLEYLSEKRELWKNTKEERVSILGYDEEDESDIVYDELIENERVVKSELINQDQEEAI